MDLPSSVLRALKDADQAQQEAWLDISYEICGLEICQMTIQQYYLLDGLDCPFFSGADFTPADIAQFLWILSPEYKPEKKAREKFLKQIKDIKILKAEEEIIKYLEVTFSDLDTLAEDSKNKRYANFLAYQIDLFAKEYGWSMKEILNLPLRQVFLLNTAIAERYANQAGKKYTKMRQVDMLEANAILTIAKQRPSMNN